MTHAKQIKALMDSRDDSLCASRLRLMLSRFEKWAVRNPTMRSDYLNLLAAANACLTQMGEYPYSGRIRDDRSEDG